MQPSLHRFTIVGAGGVGTQLGLGLRAAGLVPVQVISRTQASAQPLAEALECDWASDLAALDLQTDWLLLTVPDAQLPAVVRQLATLPLPPGLVVCHTAGSLGPEVLDELACQTGVFYPLQTLSRTRQVAWADIPILLEGAPNVVERLRQVADQLSHHVLEMPAAQRQVLHIGAVFVANFTNALVLAAEQILTRLRQERAESAPEDADEAPAPLDLGQALNYRIYLPLLREVVAKLRDLRPHDAQTGPARRGDQSVMAGHRQYLQQHHPELLGLYEGLSIFIEGVYNGMRERE